MSSERSELTKPPLDVIFAPGPVSSRRVWEIDVVEMVKKLQDFLSRLEAPDLRLAGSAAQTMSLIYRLKVETLFLLERFLRERRAYGAEEPPMYLTVPFRYELQTLSVEDLSETLDRLLEEIFSQAKEEPAPAIYAEPELPEIDYYVVQMNEMLELFRTRLTTILTKDTSLSFNEYVKGMPVLEKIRYFILLLFLASEGRVSLEQEGEDIRILGL